MEYELQIQDLKTKTIQMREENAALIPIETLEKKYQYLKEGISELHNEIKYQED